MSQQLHINDLPFNDATQEQTVTDELLKAQKRGETSVKFYGLLNNSVLEELKKRGYRVKEGGSYTTVFTGVLKVEPKSIRKL